MDMRHFRAHWKLRLLEPQRLPSIAQGLLARGYDSQILRELCLEPIGSLRDAEPLVDNLFQELREPEVSEAEAIMIVAHEYAGDIVRQRVAPYEGGRKIWKELYLRHGADTGRKLDPFVYWASEYEDADSDDRRLLCEKGIRSAAVELLKVSGEFAA